MLSPALYSVITPEGVIFPMAFVVPRSANHTLPSGPSVIPFGLLPGNSPTVYSVTAPVGVIRPIAAGTLWSVNHTLPSAPAVIPYGLLPAPRVNSVIEPRGSAAEAPPATVDARSATAAATAIAVRCPAVISDLLPLTRTMPRVGREHPTGRRGRRGAFRR
jgi:hypothetical protein